MRWLIFTLVLGCSESTPACGNNGGPCCTAAGQLPCKSADYSCYKIATTEVGTCRHCGLLGEICCEGNQCTAGTFCFVNTDLPPECRESPPDASPTD